MFPSETEIRECETTGANSAIEEVLQQKDGKRKHNAYTTRAKIGCYPAENNHTLSCDVMATAAHEVSGTMHETMHKCKECVN